MCLQFFVDCARSGFTIKPHLSDQEIQNYRGVINSYVKEYGKNRSEIRKTVGKSHKEVGRKGDTVVLEE